MEYLNIIFKVSMSVRVFRSSCVESKKFFSIADSLTAVSNAFIASSFNPIRFLICSLSTDVQSDLPKR